MENEKFKALTNVLETKPYTFKYQKGWLWFNGFYYIMFDDTKLSIVDTKVDAKKLVNMLNGAYSMGAMQVLHYV